MRKDQIELLCKKRYKGKIAIEILPCITFIDTEYE